MRYAEFAAPPEDCATVSLLVPEDGFDELDRIRAAHDGPTKVVSIQPLGPRLRGASVEVACLNPWLANDLIVQWYALSVARAFSAQCEKVWAARQSG